MDHPSDEHLRDYAYEWLSDDDELAVELHLQKCALCVDTVTRIEARRERQRQTRPSPLKLIAVCCMGVVLLAFLGMVLFAVWESAERPVPAPPAATQSPR